MKYRKKPVVIDAVQWTGDIGDMVQFITQAFSVDDVTKAIYIETREGEMRGDVGDWIIRGIKGEFYPCKPDIFAATYEPVGEV